MCLLQQMKIYPQPLRKVRAVNESLFFAFNRDNEESSIVIGEIINSAVERKENKCSSAHAIYHLVDFRYVHMYVCTL